ncbi:uncharacterized protein LACBIDRAFT_294969 [Laccaria bicolor S238N-H82]|uniref:Predicted protein n=1 Tax=Laccaria bicolor (strain S238N-H82 / ATCC MYA-4686) TaxID=486041 RepID=B0DKK0_LACBS|nr:uncharacterized protein LACBIDRAFT_294969 [Laccaria bicolor S238N-H82]EDR04957.1 predicted protein [Laccaria bicolor S238N-H82]|eukprot:XP_001884347.1 predicted protein [Laccaria bicolor S238N-H82]
MASPQTLFILGATGHLGSQFLVNLAHSPAIPQLRVVALIRKLTPETQAKLKEIYKDLEIVEGSLDEAAEIKSQAEKADYVVNCASSDHLGSIQAILAGLGNRSESTGVPPIYIHVSGLGIIGDNSRGEFVAPEKVPHYSDIGFTIDQCLPTNPHVDCDTVIVAAGTRKERPIRTMILFPGLFYGIGDGIRKTSLLLRLYAGLAVQAGFAGTWGPGYSRVESLHVKDCAEALVIMFKAALEGKADEGRDGLYFAAAEQKVELREMARLIGDVMFEKGLLEKGGSHPLPPEVIAPFSEGGWSLLGSNTSVTPARLKLLGWEHRETRKKSFYESIPEEMELVLKDMQ